MDWNEYVHVLNEFRARFGRMPPSMLTDEGALDHMREALESSAREQRAVRDRRPARPKPDA